MGCLKNVIRAIIITLAIIGFLAIGGKELIQKLISHWWNPSVETIIERAKKVGDFSQINEEFELEKAAGIMGYNAVVAEHKASGQKLLVVDTGAKKILTAEDIKSDNIEEHIRNAVKNIKYQTVSIDNLSVVKKGEINSFGKNAPYIKFQATVKKLPIGDVEGIVSVAKNSNGEDRLLISVSEKNKYSHLIAEEFFRKVK